jgi:hypothetical protein
VRSAFTSSPAHWQAFNQRRVVLLLLPAGLVDTLTKVSAGVVQANGDDWQPEIGSTLDEVTRQHAEPA